MTDGTANYGELLAKIMAIVSDRAPRVIGIEGRMSSGKSSLARRLSSDLGCAHVETDESFPKRVHPELLSDCTRDRDRNKRYVDCLDLSDLRSKIEAALASQRRVIVEGICLQDVLSRIAMAADLTIYIESVPDPNLPFQLNPPEKGRRSGQPYRDVREYHSRVCPREIADLVVSDKINSET